MVGYGSREWGTGVGEVAREKRQCMLLKESTSLGQQKRRTQRISWESRIKHKPKEYIKNWQGHERHLEQYTG
jgi:hypothetical protein